MFIRHSRIHSVLAPNGSVVSVRCEEMRVEGSSPTQYLISHSSPAFPFQVMRMLYQLSSRIIYEYTPSLLQTLKSIIVIIIICRN